MALIGELLGPFVRDPAISTMRRVLRAAMTLAVGGAVLEVLPADAYAGRRPSDFSEYSGQVEASLRRPGYARAFSLTACTSHATPRRKRIWPGSGHRSWS